MLRVRSVRAARVRGHLPGHPLRQADDERALRRLREDHCEVRPDLPCAWQLIYTRLKGIGQLDRLRKIAPPKPRGASLTGGCRVIVREDHRI